MKFLKFFLILFVFSFFSCSETVIDVVSVSATVIFDYEDSDSKPKVRLAVFLQVANEVQRTENFTVSNAETGYVWDVKNPGLFTGLNKSYAYSVSLVSPENKNIPKGAYSVIYTDAAGNQDEAKFSVDYSEELLESDSSTFKDLIDSPTENIAVYAEDGELLFMGKPKSAWKTNEAILKDYRLADTKRTCYVGRSNSVICMMPAEKLKTEN